MSASTFTSTWCSYSLYLLAQYCYNQYIVCKIHSVPHSSPLQFPLIFRSCRINFPQNKSREKLFKWGFHEKLSSIIAADVFPKPYFMKVQYVFWKIFALQSGYVVCIVKNRYMVAQNCVLGKECGIPYYFYTHITTCFDPNMPQEKGSIFLFASSSSHLCEKK